MRPAPHSRTRTLIGSCAALIAAIRRVDHRQPNVNDSGANTGDGSEAISQLAATMRALSEGTSDAVWVKGRDGAYQLINSAGARMLGSTAGEMIGRTDDSFFSADSAAEIRERDAQAMETAVAATHTSRVMDASGVVRHFVTTRSPWSDVGGVVIGLVGVSRDVTEQIRVEEALRASEQRYRLLVETSPEAIIVHRDGLLLYVNRTGALLLATDEQVPLIGRPLLDFVHPDSVARVSEAVLARARGEFGPLPAEYTIVTAAGEAVDVEALSVLVDHDGLPAVQTVLRNVTARRAAESALRDREARLRLVMQQIPAVLWATDGESRFTSVLGAGLGALGLEPDDLVGRSTDEYFGTREEGVALLRATRTALAGQSCSFEFEWMRRSFACSVEPLRGPSGAIEGTLGLAVDITERKLLENQLTYRAFHDPLTGLANRALFRDRVMHALKRVERGDEVAVIFLDLDDFKTVNDSLGHTEGDQLLEAVARRLGQSVRVHDTVARLGGDEFAILLEGLESRSEAVEVVNRVETALRPAISLRGRKMNVSASVGLAHAESGETADEVLRNADVAMYRAKEAETGHYAVFEPRMHAAAVDRLELAADLRLAAERNELVQVYQPVISLESGEIQGFEALLRWNHPRRGLLMPSMFIPLAEETGLIVDLGRWVLQAACCELHRWHGLAAAGAPGLSQDLRVGVNISSHQIRSDSFIGDVARVLTDTGVVAGRVVLELTEGALLDRTNDSLQRLQTLKTLGVQLAIDDFGTGYSALSYLQRFPIDVLKIDKSFVDGIARGGRDSALARTVLALGEMLGLRTLAEGVETPEQCAELRALGCKFAQGFLFAAAMPATEIAEWAAQHRATWSSSLALHARADDSAASTMHRPAPAPKVRSVVA